MDHNDLVQRSERLKVIIRAVESGPRRIQDLAELTGASTITIRRDLTELAEQGALRRNHGGAEAASKRGAEFPFGLRLSEEPNAKSALADAAAQLVLPGQSILIDNGTTALAIARRLAGFGVTALALSLHAAAALAERPGNEVIVPGGAVDPDDLSFTGVDAVDAVRSMRFDVAFLGACSADPTHGLTVSKLADARIKRAALASSARVILVATAEKFTRTSAHRFGSFADLDTVVTSADAPVGAIHDAREAGVTVITVTPAAAASG
ncbi:DeoR/GlpR family DNA-binding transcription regulator [Microbacterium sp. K24]|uniref:DeoR/GlpR family DNA-binding transcription regulator n=1 Tax=Microbacterium sp. K24 TaxID=2305446 RepID=UPI00109BFF1B|nr:DeoR/GlpR family DNA-binding transcription regulator [Microbacterium sp. K24]